MTTIQYWTKCAREGPNAVELDPEFHQRVDFILADPRSWGRYGYKFVRDPEARLVIKLCRPAEIARVGCSSKLSCYIWPAHKIYINYANWIGGAKIVSEGAMGLEDYKNYAINHEVGHALGLDHPNASRWAGQPGSVMLQMTKGLKWISPAQPNCWPLPSGEFASRERKPPTGGGPAPFNWFLLLVIIVILGFLFYFGMAPIVRTVV